MIEVLFVLAPLAVVPLALRQLPTTGAVWEAALRRFQPACAAPAAASFLIDPGVPAAALTIPWSLWSALLAVEGLARVRAPRPLNASTVAFIVARLYLPVGGGWLLLSRLGAEPLGFAEPLVLLTAVHFHYAAFAALVLAALAGRGLGAAHPFLQRLHGLAVAAMIAAPALIAAGITLSPALEWAGVLVQAVGIGSLALVTLGGVLRGAFPPLARGLLAVSTASAVVAATLALAYGWGELVGGPVVSIPWMARVHGTANALGFVLGGLLGWSLAGVTPGPDSCNRGRRG